MAGGLPLLAALVALQATPEVAEDRWLLGRSPHFEVYSNGARWRVEETATDLERMRTILRAAFARPDEAEPMVPLRVFAFDRMEDFQAFYPPAFAGRSWHPAGLFVHGPFEVDLFLVLKSFSDAGGRPSDAGPTIRHEFHHLYFDREAPWAPVWLREGMADLWASATLDGTTLDVGRMDPLHAEAVHRGPLIPLEELLRVDQKSPLYREADRIGIFYAESMVFTHFLLLKEPDGEAKMVRFGELLQKGTDPVEALSTCWGDLEGLKSRFEAYPRQMGFPLRRATLKEPPGEVKVAVSSVPHSRVLALEAELAVSSARPERARPLFEASLREDPKDAVALEAEGRLLLLQKRGGLARWYLQRAAEAPDSPFSAHYLLAVTAPRDKSGRFAEPERVEEELTRTLTLDSRYAPALSLLASLQVEREPARAVDTASLAARIDPGNPLYEVSLASVLKKAGRGEEASIFVSRAVGHALASTREAQPNTVCWRGALAGFAGAVIPACEKAVALSHNDWRDRDSRGVARALSGDHAGAVEDFRFVLAHAGKEPEVVRTRGQWVAELASGRDPFDAEVVASLEAGGDGEKSAGPAEPPLAPGTPPSLPSLAFRPPPAVLGSAEVLSLTFANGDPPPRLVHRVTPGYPRALWDGGVSGKVELEVIVGQDGTVADATIVSGDPDFRESALEAVRQWRYEPYLKDGRPVAWKSRVHLSFQIR